MEFNLADLFEKVVDTVPDRIGLAAGDERRTYAQWDERSNRLAQALIARGIRPGDHVGIYSYNRAEWLETMVGVFKARAVPINVNYRYLEEELAYLFDNADLKAIIYEAEFGPRLAHIADRLPLLHTFICLADETGSDPVVPGAVMYEDALASASPERPADARSPDDLYMLYTGGTTGLPKGVMWRSEDAFFGAMGGGNWGGPGIARPEDIALSAASNPAPLVMLILPPLMHGSAQWATFNGIFQGATIVLNPSRRFDPAQVLGLCAESGANTMTLVGDAMARPLVEAYDPDGHQLDRLMVIASGGAILSAGVKQAFRERLPHVIVVDSFGASETGAQGAAADLASDAPQFSMGDDTTVLSDDHTVAQPGEVGWLARRGHIPIGYYKDAEKTAATFVQVDGVRWSIPGDRAIREHDGTITLLGRGSQSINSGGEKIFPEEVEGILKTHPAVFDVLVVGVPDQRWGSVVAAVVEPRPGCTPDLESLAAHTQERIAGYKAPRRLVLVDAVVRTPAGKPDYRWARQVAEAATACVEHAPTDPTEPGSSVGPFTEVPNDGTEDV